MVQSQLRDASKDVHGTRCVQKLIHVFLSTPSLTRSSAASPTWSIASWTGCAPSSSSSAPTSTGTT